MNVHVPLQRPTTAELISWIDVETLLLLFSMMMIVAILSETGIFDYLAVYAYEVRSSRADCRDLPKMNIGNHSQMLRMALFRVTAGMGTQLN
jgi:Na+/H+ antiporter NhaD/arsenite permease-like protein